MVEALLADGTYDIISLVETWQFSYSRAFLKHAAACRYQIIFIPATISTAGHNKGGSILLFKRKLRLSSVVK